MGSGKGNEVHCAADGGECGGSAGDVCADSRKVYVGLDDTGLQVVAIEAKADL